MQMCLMNKFTLVLYLHESGWDNPDTVGTQFVGTVGVTLINGESLATQIPSSEIRALGQPYISMHSKNHNWCLKQLIT